MAPNSDSYEGPTRDAYTKPDRHSYKRPTRDSYYKRPTRDSNETLIRQNSFFTHLNHDVRCLIYDLLDLPPISPSCLGLVMSCRQALVETERNAVVHLNRFLENLQQNAQREGGRFKLPSFKLDASYATLSRLNVEIHWRATRNSHHQWTALYELLGGSSSKVKIISMPTENLEHYGAGVVVEGAALDPYDTWLLSGTHPSSGQMCLSQDALSCMAAIACNFRMNNNFHTKTVETAWGQILPETSKSITVFDPTLGLSPSEWSPMRHGVYPVTWTGPRYEEVCSRDGKAGILSLIWGVSTGGGMGRYDLGGVLPKK